MADDAVLGVDWSADGGGGAAALCTRNADGTVSVVRIAPFTGRAGDELFATQSLRVHLDAWSALTLRIWSDHVAAAAELDRVIDGWGEWVAGLACAGPFDWMGWVPWRLWRAYAAPNPVFPFQQVQFPRADRWVLPDLTWPPRTRPLDGYTLDAPFTPLTPSRWGLLANDEARRRSWRDIARVLDDADLTIEWPRDPGQPVPTHLEIEHYRPELTSGEPLAPDTNHGGDRHPGRYA